MYLKPLKKSIWHKFWPEYKKINNNNVSETIEKKVYCM